MFVVFAKFLFYARALASQMLEPKFYPKIGIFSALFQLFLRLKNPEIFGKLH